MMFEVEDGDRRHGELNKIGLSNWRFARWVIVFFGTFACVSMAVNGSGTFLQYSAAGIPAIVALITSIYLQKRSPHG